MSRETPSNFGKRQLKPWQMRLIVEATGLIGIASLYCLGTSEPSHEEPESVSEQSQAHVAGELTGSIRTQQFDLPASQLSESVQRGLHDVPRRAWDYSVPLYLEGILATEAALFVIERRRKDQQQRPLLEMRQTFDEIVQHSFGSNE